MTRSLPLTALLMCSCNDGLCNAMPHMPDCCSVCRTLELTGDKRCAKTILMEVPWAEMTESDDSVADHIIDLIEEHVQPIEWWQAKAIRALFNPIAGEHV